MLPGDTHYIYMYRAFECRADQLSWGCLLAIALNRKWFPRFFSALCASPWLMALTGAALLASAVPRQLRALCAEARWPEDQNRRA
jgi:hypothetical protein